MDDFLKSLASPSWWIGVVLVSLLINLASAYIKSPLDAFLSNVSRRWSERSVRSKQKRIALVASLAADKHKQILYLARESRCRFRELLWIALAIFLLVAFIADSLLYSSSYASANHPWLKTVILVTLVFSLISSFSQRFEAIRIASLVNDANPA